MPAIVDARRLRPLIPLVAVNAAAVVLAMPLLLLRTQWSPRQSVDCDTASDLNGLVSGNACGRHDHQGDHVWLGSDDLLWTVTMSAVLVHNLAAPAPAPLRVAARDGRRRTSATGDTPHDTRHTAASSLDNPQAIAVQNRCRSARNAIGGRPGDRITGR